MVEENKEKRATRTKKQEATAKTPSKQAEKAKQTEGEKTKKEGEKGETKKEQGKKEQWGKNKGRRRETSVLESWKPRTGIGKKVKKGEIKELGEILDEGKPILEPEIIEFLLPDLENDLLLVGQSKGKFGGGRRRVFKQTQKKTSEGNKPRFQTYAALGNKNGYVGVGTGKSRETVPAREKAIRQAKLNVIKIRRGCGSWECSCQEPHSIPYAVSGRAGSVRIKLMPAPKGTGLVVEDEIAKILSLAGIKDVWSKTLGKTKTKTNLIRAAIKAIRQLSTTKINEEQVKKLGIIEGASQEEQEKKSLEIEETEKSKEKKENKKRKENKKKKENEKEKENEKK